MRKFCIAALLLGLALPLNAARKPPKQAAVKPLAAGEILKRADDARAPEGDFSFFVKINDYDGSRLLRTQLYKVFCKGEDYALIETEAPMRLKGRKILLRHDDLWLYLPSVKKPTRISLQQRLTGEVANGDIARTRFYDDYAARITRTEEIDGKKHFVLDLKAKKDSVTYRRVQLWVDQRNYQPTKANFYAISGKLLKTSLYSDYKVALGSARASKVIIKDSLAPNKQSHLSYSQYKREELDESFFTKEALP